MNKEKLNDIWQKELWTQQEVADYFRVVPSTIKNWRDQGLLSYWQAPGSTRVLYYRDEIKDFCGKNTVCKKGGDKSQKQNDLWIKREKPIVSTKSDKKWRI